MSREIGESGASDGFPSREIFPLKKKQKNVSVLVGLVGFSTVVHTREPKKVNRQF